MDRSQAINIRKGLREAVKTKFADMATIEWFVNVATHNDILWRTYKYDQKFCLLDYRVRPIAPSDSTIFAQYTEECQPTIKEMAEFMAAQLSKSLNLPIKWVDGTTLRGEAYKEAVLGPASVQYFTKNDTKLWGRPSIIVLIDFD